MSNRDIAIDLIKKLPEGTSLQDIARELELFAGIYEAEEEADRGGGVPAEDVFKHVDAWVSP